MKVAKPTPDIIEAVNQFISVAQDLLEHQVFASCSPEESWKEWDECDDKKVCLRIRKNIAQEEGISENDVDDRIVAYEFLKKKYTPRLSHVNMVCSVLLDACCNPTEDVLEWRPDIYFQHVAPEQ
jgi:hypothetical protein